MHVGILNVSVGITRSTLGIPVVRGEAGLGYCRLFFPHFSLTILYTISVQLFLSFAVVLHSPPTLSRSLFTHSSLRILGFPRLLLPSAFRASDFFANIFISHSFFMTGLFQLTRPNLATNTVLTRVMTGLGSNYQDVLVNT